MKLQNSIFDCGDPCVLYFPPLNSNSNVSVGKPKKYIYFRIVQKEFTQPN